VIIFDEFLLQLDCLVKMFLRNLKKIWIADLLVNHFLKSGDKQGLRGHFRRKIQIHVKIDNIKALFVIWLNSKFETMASWTAEVERTAGSFLCRTRSRRSPNYLDQFHFRWLNIKGFHTAFPISITLFPNHLKWNSS